MEHKNTIKRDKLYVGELVIPYEYRLKNDGKILVYTYELCRNILFSLDSDMATDVLFEVPQYPIVNITDQSKCEIGKMAIKDAICLDELLKYFGYPEELTEEDIHRVRQTFFTGEFCLNHAELFGYKEIKIEDIPFYDENKQEITDPIFLEEKRAFYRSIGYRMMVPAGNGVLSSEYYHLLDKKANNSYYDYLNKYVESVDSFAPVKKEGHGRVLKKY